MKTHGPIEDAYRQKMNQLARELDRRFNGPKGPRRIGFALLIYDFDNADGRRMNYIGNGERDDTRVALKELLARWEGRYSDEGHA